MKLSAPIHRLKRAARLLSRREKIPLHEALDRVAVAEGFSQWSLLSARAGGITRAARVLARCGAGDLVLIGARPGQGKTRLGAEILLEAVKAGNRAMFFTLEYTEREARELFRRRGAETLGYDSRLELDTSDAISADFIARRLAAAEPGSVVVVDYLQLLDQQRNKPQLSEQILALRSLACEKRVVIILLSQIDRAYDPSAKACPDLNDVRLPNPLDLRLFSKTCFLQGSTLQVHAAR